MEHNSYFMETKLSKRIQQVPRSFIRDILTSATSPNTISFAGGLPNKNYFPIKALAESTARVLQSTPHESLQYSLSYGLPQLREIISSFYNNQGLNIPIENILITTGSQQALDLIGKSFIDSGDNIILEEPSYLGAIQAFSMYSPCYKTIKLHSNGIDVNKWKQAINESNSKFTYMIPNFQNPSGIMYSLNKRKEIAKHAIKTNSLIIEDDPYGRINFNNKILPNIYKFAPNNTLLLGSFSKSIVPGFRLGWVIGNEQIIKKLEVAKQASDLHTNVFAQYVVIDYLQNNNIQEHISKIIDVYKYQANIMFECIDRYFGCEVRYTRSKGGMFTWLTLPKHISAMELFKEAAKRDVAFIPGVPFYINKTDCNTMRLNFSYNEPEQICKGIEILANVYKKMSLQQTF